MTSFNYILLLITTIISIITVNILCVNAFNLTLIHTNDLHSHFAAVNEWSSPCDQKTFNLGKCFGGVARIAAKVKEVRAKTDKNTLFLNAGDNFQGTVWYSLYKWRIVAHFIKLLKYDAMTIGNHEFDDGVDGFYPFLNAINSTIPTVCCNLDVSNEPKLQNLFEKSIVIEIDNHKIGIIGYITPETSFLSNPGDTIKFTDEIVCVQEEVNRLKRLGINIIFGLSHSGFSRDIEIAENVADIDVIVGGHSHSLLYGRPGATNVTKPSIEYVVDSYPTLVNETLVLQASAFGKYFGLIDIEFDENGKVIRFDGQPILLNQSFPEDPEVAKEVESYTEKVKAKYGEVIGKTNVLLKGSFSCETNECNLGNLITEATVEYFMRNRARTGTVWTDVSVCVLNGGGIRSTIDAQNRDGNITLEDLITTMPFGNNMIILVLPGKYVKEMLEYSAVGHDINLRKPNSKFLQMSGMQVVYNLTKPDYQRVEKVWIRCADCRVPEFLPLNMTEEYKIIVPKYIADGGDGYRMFANKEITRIQSEVLDYQIVSDYISHTPIIYTGTDKRITFVY